MPPPVVRVPKYIGRGAFLDVPAYAGNASKALVVNGAGNGFQYVAIALAAHAHDAADITSGTIADDRIASTITRDNEVMPIVLAADGSGSGLDADLLRGVTPSVYGLALIDDADAATARATLGLGALATANVPGATTQVIYNSAGALAGDAGMTYDAANDALTVAGRVVTPVWRPSSDSATALKIKTAADADFVTLNTTDKRVGIGTTSPNQTLHVSGTGAVFERTSGSAANLSITGGTNPYIELTNGTVQGKQQILDSAAYMQIGTQSSHDLRFITGNTARGFITPDGYWLIGGGVATAWLDVRASTTTAASLRIRSGAFPTGGNRNDGDIGYVTSGRLTFYRGSTQEIFATGVQATGGIATAGGTYGATEQTMLQAVYNAARTFGLLT